MQGLKDQLQRLGRRLGIGTVFDPQNMQSEDDASTLSDLERDIKQFPTVETDSMYYPINEFGEPYKSLLNKIWGSGSDNYLGDAAVVLGAFSLFSSDAFFDRAFKSQIPSASYVDSFIERYVRDIGEAVGQDKDKDWNYIIPMSLHLNIRHDRRPYDPDGYNPYGSLQDMPSIALAYFIYETMRGAEFLAEQQGVTLTDEDKVRHFEYFSTIMRSSDCHFPDQRSTMEEIAEKVDTLLAAPTLNTFKMHKHLSYFTDKNDVDLTSSQISDFLRPGAQGSFAKDTFGKEPGFDYPEEYTPKFQSDYFAMVVKYAKQAASKKEGPITIVDLCSFKGYIALEVMEALAQADVPFTMYLVDSNHYTILEAALETTKKFSDRVNTLHRDITSLNTSLPGNHDSSPDGFSFDENSVDMIIGNSVFSQLRQQEGTSFDDMISAAVGGTMPYLRVGGYAVFTSGFNLPGELKERQMPQTRAQLGVTQDGVNTAFEANGLNLKEGPITSTIEGRSPFHYMQVFSYTKPAQNSGR